MRGGGRGRVVAGPQLWVQLCIWSPNKLGRSTITPYLTHDYTESFKYFSQRFVLKSSVSCKSKNLKNFLRFSSCLLILLYGHCTVKKFDEVVRHLHLVTQDQFSLRCRKKIPASMKIIVIKISKFCNRLSQMSNFFAINTFPTSNFLDDDPALPLRHVSVVEWMFQAKVIDVNCYTIFLVKGERSASFLKSMTNASPHWENMRGFVNMVVSRI